MALTDIQQTVTPGKKGGGLFGSVLGGVLGAIAGIATTVATWNPGAGVGAGLATAGATTASLAGAGMGLGGVAGEALDPSKAPEASQTIGQVASKKPKLSSMASMPDVQLAQVQSAKKLVPSSSLPPETADSYMKMLDAADKRLKGRLGIGGN